MSDITERYLLFLQEEFVPIQYVTGLAKLEYNRFKEEVSKIKRLCDAYDGAEKAVCSYRYKISAIEDFIKKLGVVARNCGRAKPKDVDKCTMKMKARINKMEDKILKLNNSLTIALKRAAERR